MDTNHHADYKTASTTMRVFGASSNKMQPSSPKSNSVKFPFMRKKTRFQNVLLSVSQGGQIDLKHSESNNKKSFMEKYEQKISKVANFASILCAIDCTVLPLVTVTLSLLGIAASPSQLKWLHELGHSVALFFVLPVGGLATTMNFIAHRHILPSSFAFLGLFLIYLTNGHGGPILSKIPHGLIHPLHHNMLIHRVVNLTGVACLLGSNYYLHRKGCSHDHGGSKCGHDHH